MAGVNFLIKTNGHYPQVEMSLAEAIGKHLPAQPTFSRYSTPDALNFAMFFGRGGDVFMSHGVADKNYTYKRASGGEFALNTYCAAFVPGPWLKRKLLSNPGVTLTEDQIVCVGWPRLDALIQQQKSNPISSDRPRVLWAPTHDARRHGADEISSSSFPAFERYTSELARHVDLTIGLHPRNRSDKTPTKTSLVDADVVISDHGTIVYEAWALGKPVIFPYWIVGEAVQKFRPESAEAFIFSQRIGHHANSFRDLLDLVMSNPTVSSDVVSFMNDYLPTEYLGNSGKRCADELIKLARNIRDIRQGSLFQFRETARRSSIAVADENIKTRRSVASLSKQVEKLTNENARLKRDNASTHARIAKIENWQKLPWWKRARRQS
jgi:hypothetical protein